MIKYRIYEMQDVQIEEVMNIWLTSTLQGHPFIARDYWEANYKVVKEQYLPLAKTFVYEEGKQIQGFISIIEGNFIGALFVDTHSQGKGVGKALIDYCKTQYEVLELAVYVENQRAVDFYKKQGFHVIAEQENEDSKAREYGMRWEKVLSV